MAIVFLGVLFVVGGGLLVLLSYGVGLIVNLVLHFEPFQVTVLCMAGIIGVGLLTIRVLSTPLMQDKVDDSDDEYLEDDYLHNSYDVPNWRQPLKSVDFTEILPDDRCTCGSGRKYKNCHGVKRGEASNLRRYRS